MFRCQSRGGFAFARAAELINALKSLRNFDTEKSYETSLVREPRRAKQPEEPVDVAMYVPPRIHLIFVRG